MSKIGSLTLPAGGRFSENKLTGLAQKSGQAKLEKQQTCKAKHSFVPI
jgi:hypothetical protein